MIGWKLNLKLFETLQIGPMGITRCQRGRDGSIYVFLQSSWQAMQCTGQGPCIVAGQNLRSPYDVLIPHVVFRRISSIRSDPVRYLHVAAEHRLRDSCIAFVPRKVKRSFIPHDVANKKIQRYLTDTPQTLDLTTHRNFRNNIAGVCSWPMSGTLDLLGHVPLTSHFCPKPSTEGSFGGPALPSPFPPNGWSSFGRRNDTMIGRPCPATSIHRLCLQIEQTITPLLRDPTANSKLPVPAPAAPAERSHNSVTLSTTRSATLSTTSLRSAASSSSRPSLSSTRSATFWADVFLLDIQVCEYLQCYLHSLPFMNITFC